MKKRKAPEMVKRWANLWNIFPTLKIFKDYWLVKKGSNNIVRFITHVAVKYMPMRSKRGKKGNGSKTIYGFYIIHGNRIIFKIRLINLKGIV